VGQNFRDWISGGDLRISDTTDFLPKLGSRLIPCTPTSCGLSEFWVGGDYTTGNEYI